MMYLPKTRTVLAVLAVSLFFGFFRPGYAFAATTPTLGAAETYGVLAGTYTNVAAGTTINGDVGFITAPAMVPAGLHINYGVGAPTPTARIDVGTALTALDTQLCTFIFAPGAIDLSTDVTHGPLGVYPPGVYCSTGAMNISGALTLNGAGTYIFRPTGALTSTVGSVITLVGASACDVFWTPTAATTLAANTTFFGTIIDNANAITLGVNTLWTGRALSLGAGTVTTDTNTITVPICTATIHIIKTMINNNAGVGVASDAIIHFKTGGIDVPGSPQAGAGGLGTTYTVNPGTYVVSENVMAGYNATFSGNCNLGGSIVLASGDDKICTITNDDIAPATITVTKIVINDNGRTKGVADFPLFVNGVPVVSGVTNIFLPASYSVTETTDANYIQSFSGDCTLLGVVTLAPGDAKFCIITNNDIAPTYVPGGSYGGGGGGYSAPQPIAPLIDVVKIPSPLALPNGPGPVTYTYTLRNVGTVVVSDVTLVGDSCGPIVLVSGDTNHNLKLDINEVWIHTCTTILTETHTNTVVATGWANSISTVDIASATVVVGIPLITPIIHVIKIPRPFTVPTSGDWVTYTEIINNPGTVSLSNIRLTDDKCRPVKYAFGDTNFDSKLDLNERWVYTCRAFLTSTTTNTVFASGTGNGITVRDLAVATVVAIPPIVQVPPMVVPADPVINPTPVPVIVDTVIPKFPKTGVAPEKIVAGIPVSIKIPDIGVSAVIQQVGLTRNDVMDIPSDYREVGWYKNGPRPGEVGNAVLDGHLNWINNVQGVFADLRALIPGNRIIVEDDSGSVMSFLVRESKLYLASDDATEVFSSKDGKAHLNLITCEGRWDKDAGQYEERLVVFAERE